MSSSKVGNVPTLLKNWTRITMHKMKGFLVWILHMDIIKKSTIASYWSTFCSQATPRFGKMFTEHSFYRVNKEGLPDPREPDYDPCVRYQPLVDHANRLFRHHYNPHQEINVHETLAGTKNRTSLMQYSLKKHHHHWGIKFWLLCDCVQLLPRVFHIQRSQTSRRQGKCPPPSKWPGLYHCKKLLEIGGYLNKRYHVFIHN
jgi:hypothetical protein